MSVNPDLEEKASSVDVSENVIKQTEQESKTGDDECRKASQLMGDKALAPNFAQILNRDGPTVKAVLLKADGTAIETDYDTTPRAMHARSLVNGQPSIVGQYHELDVIVVSGKFGPDDASVPLNTNSLRWPFDEHKIRGNILLYRVDQACNNVDFRLTEYESFLAEKWKDSKLKADWERDCAENPSLTEKLDLQQMVKDAFGGLTQGLGTIPDDEDENGSENENDNGVTDDESDELLICDENNDEMMSMEKVGQIIREKMRDQYVAKNGKQPSDPELDMLTEAAMAELMEWNKQFEDDDNENDDEEDDESQNENGDAFNDSKQQEQMDSILEAAQFALDDSERSKILAMAKQMYEEEIGANVPADELLSAFEALKAELPNGQTESKTAKTGDSAAVAPMPLSEEELRQQVSNTFDSICKLGESGQSRMIDSVCQTFKEWKGVSPDAEKVSSIFETIKETFDEHDKLAEFENIAVSNKLTPAQEEMALKLGVKTLYNQESGTTSQELRDYAIKVVKQELQEKAKQQFVASAGRQPSKQEFVEILVQLATETFVTNDEKEEKSQEPPLTGVVFQGPVLTTPVRKVGKTAARVDFYAKSENAANEKLVRRSLKKFEKIQKRHATPEDIKRIKEFLAVDGELLEDQFEDAAPNEVSEANESKDDQSGNLSKMEETENETKNEANKENADFGLFSFGGSGFGNGNATNDNCKKAGSKVEAAFAAMLNDDSDDSNDSDYVPPEKSVEYSDDDIEDFIDESAEDRPLV